MGKFWVLVSKLPSNAAYSVTAKHNTDNVPIEKEKTGNKRP